MEFNVQWLPSQVLNGSFLDLCFVNQVQGNNGACAKALKTKAQFHLLKALWGGF